MSLPYQMDLAVKIKASGVLDVSPICYVDQCCDIALWLRCERNPTQSFQVNGGRLFALTQIRDGGGAFCRRHPVGDAAAGAAAVQPQHEAGFFRRPAMDEGVDAQRPVQPDEPRRDTFEIGEARLPHQ